MPVIALTQEMGSLSKDVAGAVASAMGLSEMRHEVIEHVADKMDVPTSLIGRLRGGKAGLIERMRTDTRSIAIYTAEELFAQADRGNVVLRGWGATVLLRPVPHVVCVRVTRSFDRRLEWLMGSLDTDDADFARAELQRSDAAHAARMNALYGVSWGDPVLYDLVLNTDRLSVDSCVELIRTTAARPEFAETDESHAIVRRMAVEARVRAALKADAVTREIDITVRAGDGPLALRGIVVSEAERERAGAVASIVVGVGNVDNQLQLMKTKRRFASAKY